MNKTYPNLLAGKGKTASHYVSPPFNRSPPCLSSSEDPNFAIQQAELNFVDLSPEVDIYGGTRRDDDMFQDGVSPMSSDTIHAARENDDSYLCWQKVWPMLASGNRTVQSTYLNMESSTSFKTFQGSPLICPWKFPMLRPCKFQG